MSKSREDSPREERGMNLCRKQTGVYYYQRRIPNDLIEAYDGKKKFMFSLQTKDRQEAIKRARLEGLKHDQEFDSIRRRREQLERISESDLEIIAIREANTYFDEISEEYRSQLVEDKDTVLESININMDIYSQALEIVLNEKKTSISYLQRRLRIGYNKAANLIEEMDIVE